MQNIKDKHIEFVAKHYEPNKLDTQKALARFRLNHGIDSHKRRALAWWSAASVACIAVAIFALMRTTSVAPTSQIINILAKGETLVAYLPDSTKVTLAEGSTLSYDATTYGTTSRQVEMSGEIFFCVTRNEKSPFCVTAQKAKVEVLGTQFALCENSANTELYVESGKVRFSSRDNSSSLVFTRGESAMLSSDNRVTPTEPISANPAAWATGRFRYESEPINQVLSELSIFYGVHLTCDSTSQSLTATFSTGNLDSIIAVIESVLNIKITKE